MISNFVEEVRIERVKIHASMSHEFINSGVPHSHTNDGTNTDYQSVPDEDVEVCQFRSERFCLYLQAEYRKEICVRWRIIP